MDLSKKSLCIFLIVILQVVAGRVYGMEASAIVEKAFDHLRGETSVSTVVMTIHRPEWNRAVTIKSWTRGKKDALFFIESPPKDAGNGTLKKGREMWTYNPKVNRVIKLPPSMMSQSWMGSDFSNNDLSKTDSILEDYVHRILSERTDGEQTVYEIESVAKEEAPVVWGKQVLKIRSDGIMLSQAFYDEDGEIVKIMTTAEIRMMGGRLYPSVWQMRKAGETDRFTRVEYRELTFDVPLKPVLFTRSSLKRVRR